MSSYPYNNFHVIEQARATRALIKFCEDHGYDVSGVQDLRNCLKALKRKDMKTAVELYLGIPIGGMGCFNDWLPPVVFQEETEEYARAVFEALISHWSILMSLSAPKR